MFTTPRARIATTLAAGAWLAAVGPPAPLVQLGLAGLAVAVGLPHGATDHLHPDLPRAPWFQLAYLSMVAACALLWWLVPPAGLTLFVVASMAHFGAADVADRGLSPRARVAVGLTRGALVLSVLALSHGPTVAGWLAPLGGRLAIDPQVAWWIAVVALQVHVLAVVFRPDRSEEPRQAPVERRPLGEAVRTERLLLESGVLAAWVWFAPPLLAFSLYFVVWHSLPQLAAQVRHGRARSLGALLFSAVPHTLGAAVLVGAGGLWLVGSQGLDVVPAGLALLGVLSLPHIGVEAWRGWRRGGSADPVPAG